MRKIIWGLRNHAVFTFKESVSFGKWDVCQGSKYLEDKNLSEAKLSVRILKLFRPSRKIIFVVDVGITGKAEENSEIK